MNPLRRPLAFSCFLPLSYLSAIRSLLLMSALSPQMVAPCAASTVPKPPVADRVPHVTQVHGKRLGDDYFWLRQKSNAAVAAYLEAENAYADAVLRPAQPLQEQLYQEMLGHLKETDLEVPNRDGGWFYYSRTEKGKQYRIYCRKRGSLDAAEEVVLDVNELAKGEKFMSLGALDVSDDGNLLAYSTDNTGFRQYTLVVKDLRTGQVLPQKREKTGAVAWAADNRTLFYSIEDHAKRQYRLYRHRLGEANDDLIYEEKDERFNVGVSRTRSKAFLFLGSTSLTASEYRFLPAAQPDAEWKLVAAREPEHEYYPDHRGDLFYIRSNKRGRNFGLFTAPMSDPRPSNWKELVAPTDRVMLEDHDLFANHLVTREREGGLPHLRVTDLRNGASHRLAFPEPTYVVFPDANAEFDTSMFRYSYSSLVTPRSVFDYDMDKRTTKLLKETEVPGGFDKANYESLYLHATATDGTRIPISLVYRKGLRRDGRAPMFLYAYGSYGASSSAYFQSGLLPLLDRGVVFAIAHIRGGGELGKAWHDDGRMMKKKNTFTDFIACAEFLIAEKFTNKDRLAIMGGSAGGLLMGAVVNLRPDLFKAVVSLVPFVDVVNTMLDESLPLTVGEFEEWGNPKVKAEYDYLKTYCPYTNLRRVKYPAMLIRTSFNDSQVMYWEPAKYVAKLRTLQRGENSVLFKTNMAAGHGGASGRYDKLRENALNYAFVLTQLGLEK